MIADAAMEHAVSSTGPFISITNVRKRFGSLEALKGVSLDVREGETVALIGPSGSGKSTLLRCINGLELVDDGRVVVNGEMIGSQVLAGRLRPLSAQAVARQRRNIGMVFQSFNLFAHMTAAQNVASGLVHVKGVDRAEAHRKALQLLKRVGLEDKPTAYPRQLSGGQQQRVAIARALAMEPKVMLFDEPTSALDPETVQEVLNVIGAVRESGMTMLIATHEMEFARCASDTTVFMEAGQIVERGPSEQLFTSPQTDRCRRFLMALSRPT